MIPKGAISIGRWLRHPPPPPIRACCMFTQTTQYPTSNKYMLALIVINQMGKDSQALSSRQRAPPSVCPSASGVRAPLQVGKSRVKGGVAAFGRRPWVGTRQGRRPRDDRLHCRVDMECCCTRGAVEWTWDAVAFGRRRWLGSERRQRAPPCVSAAG